MTLPAAVALHAEWQRYQAWFHTTPHVVVRPIPNPLYSECGLFDVVLRKLPEDFWPKWAAHYKQPVASLLGLQTREAADRVRRLPAVLFRAVPESSLAMAISRTRRAFNQPYCDLLPLDALAAVPHVPPAEHTNP